MYSVIFFTINNFEPDNPDNPNVDRAYTIAELMNEQPPHTQNEQFEELDAVLVAKAERALMDGDIAAANAWLDQIHPGGIITSDSATITP